MYFSLIILFSSISKPATTKMNPLSLHDALPIFVGIEVGGKECSLHFNRPAIFPVGRLLDPDLAAWHGLEVTGPAIQQDKRPVEPQLQGILLGRSTQMPLTTQIGVVSRFAK